MDEKVLLAGMIPESLVNGIGLRFVLFAQICKHNCKGCFNPETHSPSGGEWFHLSDIITKLKSNPILSGVTFSGGDPFEQADKFAYLAKSVRTSTFDVWCFTGYTYEYLLENRHNYKGWDELLNHIDVLIDGPFEQENYDPNLKFRGSNNQRIIDVPNSMSQNRIITINL